MAFKPTKQNKSKPSKVTEKIHPALADSGPS